MTNEFRNRTLKKVTILKFSEFTHSPQEKKYNLQSTNENEPCAQCAVVCPPKIFKSQHTNSTSHGWSGCRICLVSVNKKTQHIPLHPLQPSPAQFFLCRDSEYCGTVNPKVRQIFIRKRRNIKGMLT